MPVQRGEVTALTPNQPLSGKDDLELETKPRRVNLRAATISE